MDFLSYLSFFDGELHGDLHGEEKWLIMYWMAQGIIKTSTVITAGGAGEEMGLPLEEVEILVERMMMPLLRELYDRSLIDERHKLLPRIKNLMRDAGRTVSHKFWIDENSLPTTEHEDEQWTFVATTVSTEINGSGTSLPPSPRWSSLTTLLIRCGTHVLQLDIPPYFFEYMSCIRVLHLISTPIACLPSSISSLCGLRLLRLHGCKQLTAIPSSLKALEKLEFLDLSKCESLEIIPDDVFERMSNLRFLHLSSSKIESLPSSVSNLCGLQHLHLVDCKSIAEIQEKSFNRTMRLFEVLNLFGASYLTSLPSSLSNLVGLKKLILNNCYSLKTIVLGAGAHSLSNLSNLEVLDLGNCSALEDIECVSFEDLVPSIKKIDLRGMTTPKRLSFQGCRKLEYLDLSFIECLEALNLSGTSLLKTFYFDTSLQEHPLRHLEVLPIRYEGIRDVVPFEGLNWVDNDVGANIWLSRNEDILIYLPKEIFSARCFSRFHIGISSSTKVRPSMPMPMGDFPNILFQRNQFVYQDIYRQIQTYILSNFRSTYDRHLEIFESYVEPRNLQHLLPEAKLLTLYGNSYVATLFYHHEKRSKLKECRIASCQSLITIFDPQGHRQTYLESLEVLWGSDLPQLTTVCEDWYKSDMSLTFLKHVHLERCPNLVVVFTSNCHIESLETLEIKFCSRLKVVCDSTVVSLQSLRSLCLLQLPKLKSICTVNLPKLQKMRVRGCRMLRKLPLGARIINDDHVPYDASDVIEIEGETNWWKDLQWANEEHDIDERPVRFRPARSHVLVKQRK